MELCFVESHHPLFSFCIIVPWKTHAIWSPLSQYTRICSRTYLIYEENYSEMNVYMFMLIKLMSRTILVKSNATTDDWRLTTMTTTSNGIRKERKLKKRRERQWEIDNIITWAYLSFAFLRTVISMLMYGYILDDTLLFNIISLLYMHTRRRKRKKN